MISLAAVAPEDGWAILYLNRKLHLIRPPYGLDDMVLIDNSVLGTAISKWGFRRDDREFESMHDLLTALRVTIQSYREARGAPSDAEITDTILRSADRHELDILLQSVSDDLLQHGLFEQARDMLIAMLQNPVAAAEKDIRDRIITMLEDANERGRKRRSGLDDVFVDERLRDLFPRATDEYGSRLGSIAGNTRQRHSVWVM